MMSSQEHMEVYEKADCGNSPKNLFLKDFAIALARGDVDYVFERVTENMVWMDMRTPGQKGLNDLKEEIFKNQTGRVLKLELSHALSHGKAGAVDGVVQMADGRQLAFCGIFEFASAKADRISLIKSYVVSVG